MVTSCYYNKFYWCTKRIAYSSDCLKQNNAVLK